MLIKTVKIQPAGFLVNGDMGVPNDTGNRHYIEVLEWVAAGNIPEPAFTAVESLNIAKGEKALELAVDYRESAEADVLVSGSMYPADRDYQLIVLTLASRASRGRSNPTAIRGRDGVSVTLTPALLDSLEDAIFNQIATALETLAIKQELVNSAISVAEVEAITFAG